MANAHSHSHDHDHGHDHGHAHGHHHHGPVDTGDWRYAVGLIVNLAFVGCEVVAGLWSGSTALLADAGHNLSDVLGLAMAGGAAWLARRSAGSQKTYGYGKATVLAALANAILLIFACGAIAVEAAQRLNGDAEVQSGVVIAGAVILFTGWSIVDPTVSLVIVAVILWGTWGLLKDSVNLALDAAPRNVDVAAVRAALIALPGVTAVHDLHVWGLSTTETALTAHLCHDGGEGAALLGEAQTLLRARFGIGHSTLQLETEPLPDCPAC